MAGLAARHPADVAGLVLLETPKAITVSTLPPEVVEQIACDSPTNIERRDYIAVEHDVWDARSEIGEFPMTISLVPDNPGREGDPWLSGNAGPRRRYGTTTGAFGARRARW